MDIKEKAKEYAEGKALNAITAAIEEAYASGYKDGYDDGVASREIPQAELKYAGLTYVDLDLPSGSKWTNGYLRIINGSIELLDYDKAKVFNLPTEEQYKELLENTDQLFTNKEGHGGTEFVSLKNRARFFIPSGYCDIGTDNIINEDNYVFWLKDTCPHPGKSLSVLGSTIKETDKGFKLPVVLVSK